MKIFPCFHDLDLNLCKHISQRLICFSNSFQDARDEDFDDSSMLWFCLSENVTTPRVSSKTTKLELLSKQIGNELVKKNFPRNYHERK